MFSTPLAEAAGLTRADEHFLEQLERQSFMFFREQTDPTTGLVADRARADGSNRPQVASIAATGFGLSAWCVAEQRRWVSRTEARQVVATTLRFLADKLPNEHGFFFHFVDRRTGTRVWDCELSSIDTGLLLAGVLTARQHFEDDEEIVALATRIWERVDWPWMLNGGRTLSMGWTPERGFIAGRWDGYSEHPLLYLLGLGSPTHPLPPDSWQAWRREPVVTYGGRTFLQCPPLFTHQYTHAWVDLRHRRDAHADYWQNSVLATLAHREMCLDLQPRFPRFGPQLWGITASDGPGGYGAWGGPPPTGVDGLIVPCAPAGSLPFAPRECLAALRHLRRTHGRRTWKRYGFVDAFNPHTSWTGPDVIGIDVGITILMAENLRSGLIWERFMANPELGWALERAGFVDTGRGLRAVDRRYLGTLAADTWRCVAAMVDPVTGLPADKLPAGADSYTSASNIGLYLSDVVAAHELGLIGRADAERRLKRTVTSVARLRTWHGFHQCWNSTQTLAPGTNDTWISILDSANLAAGLVAAGEAFPVVRAECAALVAAMDWGAFYRPATRQLVGGFNTATGKFNEDWRLNAIGTDARLASFFAIASGRVPPESWGALDRSLEERAHTRYWKPGWDAGGLFMQYLTGLWLDERNTPAGRSAQNFAYAQIMHGQARGQPWGWSSSLAPNGEYLGWGRLRDDVVTPHASILALGDYPQAVLANLRELERRGARHQRLGFYDAIEVRSNQPARAFLLLDQSMALLSLANTLRADAVRRQFQAAPLVQRGRRLIADYRDADQGARMAVCLPDRPGADLRDQRSEDRGQTSEVRGQTSEVRGQRTEARMRGGRRLPESIGRPILGQPPPVPAVAAAPE